MISLDGVELDKVSHFMKNNNESKSSCASLY